MSEVSARPEALRGWSAAAAEIRVAVLGRIGALRVSYDAFQTSGSVPVANPGLMDGALPGLLGTYEGDEAFVDTVGQAFARADAGGLGVRNPDGTVTMPAGAFPGVFEETARALGLDPAALLAARVPMTVDGPIAGGVPRTSGFVADPVCTATGHLVEVEDDLVWPDRLAVLRWTRTYSSRFVGEGALGRGWACWASALLLREPDGAVAYHGPDGQMAIVPPADGGRGWARVPGLLGEVHADGEGLELRWDLHSGRPGQRWTFDADGLLRRVSGPTIGVTEFGHDAGLLVRVEHDGGRSVAVRWEGARIVGLLASDGREVAYQYDDRGDLVAAIRAVGDMHYSPDEHGRLVEARDADGVRLFRNTFDDEGRVLTQVSPFGRETTFRYEPGRRTVVGDRSGGPTQVFEHDETGRLIGLAADGRRLVRAFDADGRCLTATGFDGEVTTRQHDADGRLVSMDGPAGSQRWSYDELGRVRSQEVGDRQLRFDYSDDGPIPSRASGPHGWELRIEHDGGAIDRVTDADGASMAMTRDADGNVTTITNGLGAATQFRHHPSGAAIEVVTADGTTFAMDVDDAGRTLAMHAPTGDTWRVEWSPAGRLLAAVEPDGARTEVTYGSHGNAERITDAAGATTDLVHDHLQRLVRVVCPDGAKWEFDHTDLGALSAVVDPTGAAWRYGYDEEGRPVEAVDPLGGVTRWQHDAAGQVVATTDRTGTTTACARDERGAVIAVVGADGATTTSERDAWGRTVATVDPDGITVRWEYTPAGRVRSIRNGAGWGQDLTYDAAGRVITSTDAAGAVTTYGWDVCDRLISVTTPSGRIARYRYDAMGRKVGERRGGFEWTTGHDHAGRTTTITDPMGNTRRFGYDARGKLVSAVDALGGTARIRYDLRGNAIAMVDQRGSVWTARYDGLRRVVGTNDPLGREVELIRDAAGGLAAVRSAAGSVVRYRRDAEGRVSDVALDDRDEVALVRDRSGRPILVHEPALDRTHAYTWSPAGRLLALDTDGHELAWTYDVGGAVSGRTMSGAVAARYERDPSGRIVAVDTGRAGVVRLERDADGRLVAVVAAGLERRWAHDDTGATTAYHQAMAGEGVTDVELERDAAGRVVASSGPDGRTAYAYDDAGQLVGVEGPTEAWTFTYDEAGRLVEEVGPGARRTFRHDDAHQLIAVDGPDGTTTFDHDLDGRRVAEHGPGGGITYEWDGLGRLRGVERGGRRHSLDTDALGRLCAVDGVELRWDITPTVSELLAIGETEVVSAAGVPLGMVDGDGTVSWLAADWRGSPVPTDPWGAASSGVAGEGPVLSSFGELEVAGLLHLRDRFYDAVTRAMLSRDPVAGVAGMPFQFNPYHYAGNDPVGHVDPSGRQPISIDQYNEIRAQETGPQWGNIAMVGLMAASFLVPGGPIIATLIGAGIGAAPGIIEGITTGEWDVGAIVRGGVVGGIAGRIGFAAGGRAATFGGAVARGGAGGLATGVITEGYDLAPLPGSDGQFDLSNVVVETAVGGLTGGIGHRLSSGSAEMPPNQTTILGENMTERVMPFAEATGARTLGFGSTADEWAAMTPQQRYHLNDGQLRARINEGDDFRYIGQDPARPPEVRERFDLTRSELLRLDDRGVPYEVVSPDEVIKVIGRP